MNSNRNYPCLLTVLLVFLVLSSSAQLRLAAVGGVHFSDFIQKNSIPGYDTSNGKYFSPKTGFELGVLAEIPLGKNNFFLQPGILYSAKGNQYERVYDSTVYHSDTLYDQHTLNLNYVEIPFYFTWKASLSTDKKNWFYISAGPYFSFIFGVSQTYQNRIKQYNTQKYIYQTGTEDLPVGDGQCQYKTFDMGLTAKAGFELGSVLIGAYFSRGVTNSYSAAYSSSFHNQVFGGSLGIWLNKVKQLEEPVMDSDQDGTPDRDDSCKTIAGPPRWHGCPVPDSDLDGVNDEQDSCKTIAGPLKYHGCPVPDTDGDGINDEADSCKTVAGTLKYNGCPIPDRDQDGVNDEVDHCPDQPGYADNQGCPIIAPAINIRAELVAANVIFTTNSINLKSGSYPAIRELADSLKANPELDLLIEGHTDNIGSPGYNEKLSVERAENVKKVLVGLGIVPGRIQARGYGDTQPMASNSNAAGRAKNRRVVFVFQLKNR